jgi:hypothetical protein
MSDKDFVQNMAFSSELNSTAGRHADKQLDKVR